VSDSPSPNAWTWRRHREMLWVAAVVVVLAAILEVLPSGRVALSFFPEYPLPESCLSKSWMGVECPGCGLTRSFVHLAHGRLGDSLAVHRVGWVLALSLLGQFPYRWLALKTQSGQPFGKKFPHYFANFLIALLIGNWLFNMLAKA
jgi:Protein of unknown function (DUF2752)